jgi:hypothetical protein
MREVEAVAAAVRNQMMGLHAEGDLQHAGLALTATVFNQPESFAIYGPKSPKFFFCPSLAIVLILSLIPAVMGFATRYQPVWLVGASYWGF